MCGRCDAYADQRPAGTDAALAAVLAMAHQAETAGDLEWLDGDAALRTRPLPARAGAQRGRWICSECSRVFLLELGTSHPLGDGWRPLFGN